MAIFETLLRVGEGVGLFDYYLPFLITFAIIYGLLNKTKIFGEKKEARGINAIVALVAAFYVIAYTPVGAFGFTIGQFFTQFFGGLSVILVSLLAFAMIFVVLFALTGKDWGTQKAENWVKYLLVAAALIAVGLYLSTTSGISLISGLNISGAGIGLSDQDVAIIVLLVITALAIWWLTKENGAKKLSMEELQAEAQRRQRGG